MQREGTRLTLDSSSQRLHPLMTTKTSQIMSATTYSPKHADTGYPENMCWMLEDKHVCTLRCSVRRTKTRTYPTKKSCNQARCISSTAPATSSRTERRRGMHAGELIVLQIDCVSFTLLLFCLFILYASSCSPACCTHSTHARCRKVSVTLVASLHGGEHSSDMWPQLPHPSVLCYWLDLNCQVPVSCLQPHHCCSNAE